MGSEINAIPSRVAFVTKFQNFIKIVSKNKEKRKNKFDVFFSN